MYQIYSAFVQVNLKNRLLLENATAAAGLDGTIPDGVDLLNIKDDIILMQFKLVNKETLKTHNTMSFVNLPATKLADANVSTILEILQKQNKAAQAKQQAGAPYLPKLNKEATFMPYNKSILTRVIAQQLQKNNVLVFSHHTKRAL